MNINPLTFSSISYFTFNIISGDFPFQWWFDDCLADHSDVHYHTNKLVGLKYQIKKVGHIVSKTFSTDVKLAIEKQVKITHIVTTNFNILHISKHG